MRNTSPSHVGLPATDFSQVPVFWELISDKQGQLLLSENNPQAKLFLLQSGRKQQVLLGMESHRFCFVVSWEPLAVQAGAGQPQGLPRAPGMR